jgi:hypothetical protein
MKGGQIRDGHSRGRDRSYIRTPPCHIARKVVPPNTLHVERYKHRTCTRQVSVVFDNLVQKVIDDIVGI